MRRKFEPFIIISLPKIRDTYARVHEFFFFFISSSNTSSKILKCYIYVVTGTAAESAVAQRKQFAIDSTGIVKG